MPRLRPAIEIKEEPPKPVRQLIEPDEDQLGTPPVAKEQEAKPTEVEVVVEGEKPDDASLALKKQIEDLKKSEELQRNYAEQLRREREEMMRASAESAKATLRAQRETVEQEEVAIESTLAANRAEAERALASYKAATDAGDSAAAAEAIERLAEAKANVKTLERGIEEVKARKKELKRERDKLKEARKQAVEAPQPPPTGDPVDSFNLPPAEKDWLRNHRDYMTDPNKAADLDYVHKRAVIRGLQPGNPEYLPFINSGLAALNGQVETQAESEQKSSIMSAPVSREIASGSGQRPSSTKVTLTREEREIAKTLDLTESEYAKQKQKLAEMRANGSYGERQ